jgi:predicted nucleotidyltransferase
MRIDPKGTVGGHPAVSVRNALRSLVWRMEWDLVELVSAASLGAGEGPRLAEALSSEGLIERTERGLWKLTQAGMAFSSATAAKPIKRATAERALSELLERVEQVNGNPYFLGKVLRVVLFGSMLKPEVMLLSDVDVAVEIVAKEGDFDRLRELNYQRVEELAAAGRRFGNVIDVECCWHFETFQFLKGRSRAISLVDYKSEKAFILKVPRRMLLGEDEVLEELPASKPKRTRRPSDCPF